MNERPHLPADRISVGKLTALWPWLFVLAVSVPVLMPFFIDPPLSHDHPVRIYQAWNFWTELLSKGKLRGWSHYYGFGYPAGELYPFGAEAWVALFRALTFGAFSWLRTYGIALAGALLFAAFGMLSFTRRQFGSGAAVIAAILNLLDPGGWAEGGWYWHTELGVWPVTLAMGMVLFALAKLSDLLVRRRASDIPIAAGLIAISLLTHLLPLTVYPITIPLLLLDRRLRDGQLPFANVSRMLAACALGFGLAAFSVIPMMARTNLTLDLGVQGAPVQELGAALANGTVFSAMWSPLFALGMIGVLFALFRPGHLRPFAPFAMLIALILSSNFLVHDLHMERVVGGLIKVEAHRFVLVAKLFFYPLVGHAVVTLFRLTALARARGTARIGRNISLVLAAVVIYPVALPTVRALYRGQVVKRIQTPKDTQYWEDLSEILVWSKQARQASKDFYRIAYDWPIHDHLAGMAPMLDQTMMYKIGYTPAGIFNRFPMSGERELLEALSVKYVISDHTLNTRDYALERTVGTLRVYRFNHYRAEPFVVLGKGKAKLLSFEPEAIKIRVSRVNDATRLKLSVAAFPSWQATLDGVELPITVSTVHDAEYPMLMEVPITHDGELQFRYVRRFPDWLGLGLTLAACAILGTAIVVGPGRFRAPRLRQAGEPARRFVRRVALSLSERFRNHRVIGYGLAGLGTLALGAVLWLRAKPPLPPDSIFREDLPVSLQLADTPCTRTGFAAFRCGDERVEAEVRSGLYGAHLCMHAPFGPLQVRLNVPAPRFIGGRYDTEDVGGEIVVSDDDLELGRIFPRDPSQGLQFFQFDTRSEAGKQMNLKVTVDGAPLHCFDLSLVR